MKILYFMCRVILIIGKGDTESLVMGLTIPQYNLYVVSVSNYKHS